MFLRRRQRLHGSYSTVMLQSCYSHFVLMSEVEGILRIFNCCYTAAIVVKGPNESDFIIKTYTTVMATFTGGF
jgi:hypothetical protein